LSNLNAVQYCMPVSLSVIPQHCLAQSLESWAFTGPGINAPTLTLPLRPATPLAISKMLLTPHCEISHPRQHFSGLPGDGGALHDMVMMMIVVVSFSLLHVHNWDARSNLYRNKCRPPKFASFVESRPKEWPSVLKETEHGTDVQMKVHAHSEPERRKKSSVRN